VLYSSRCRPSPGLVPLASRGRGSVRDADEVRAPLARYAIPRSIRNGPRKRDAETRESDGDAACDGCRAGVHWLHPPAVDLANGNASRIWWIARDQFATYGSLSGAIGLAAQVIFAMFSVIQVWRR